MYGLEQAYRQWNLEITKFLLVQGFIQSVHDNSLFTHSTTVGFIVVLLYVDDMLLIGTNIALIDDLKAQLHAAFTIKDLGKARFFLGIEICRS